jgi:glycosyltransferase involved in cell wall biosynthesis
MMETVVPLVSVCIRTFDRPAELREAIGSVLAQTFRDLEVVVSDDGGRSAEAVQTIGDSRVRYHRNPAPAGATANTRTVMGLARGDLLALLDDDDRWLPGFLEAVVEAFRREPDAGVVFTDQFWEITGRRIRRHFAAAPGRQRDALPMLFERSIPPSATVLRREVWEQGERDLPLADFGIGDATIWLRAAQAGWPFVHVPRPLSVYRWHARQMSWSDPRIAERYAATLERFAFREPSHERMRRARLAEARWAQAGVHLRGLRLRDARDAARAARRAAPMGVRGLIALTGLRPFVARRLAAHPVLFRAAIATWPRLRPPVSPRP